MLQELIQKANTLLDRFKKDTYIRGTGCLDQVGSLARSLGSSTLIVANHADKNWKKRILDVVKDSIQKAAIDLVCARVIEGARPNAPREDVYRIEAEILHHNPDFLCVVGSGSTTDAVKAANALSCLGKRTNDLEEYFGVGRVSAIAKEAGIRLRPLVAVMLASSSAAHLTKYSNITDPAAGQKKLIVDEIVVPDRALFDYATSITCPLSLTLDGGMDGMAHCLEVYYGAGENLELLEDIALCGIELAMLGLERVVGGQDNEETREILGLATDLGGYAIMTGGTNGGHLTSFSLVDILSHGRACALLNPYYTVFFAPAIEEKLHSLGDIYRRHGYISKDLQALHGRELGLTVARGMLAFSRAIEFPATLSEVAGFSETHIERALIAAKNPQLEMKLKSMPVALDATLVDEYMGPILRAAMDGHLELIKNL